MYLLAQMRDEGIVEAGLEHFQLFMLLDQDIVLQDIENPIDFTPQLAKLFEQCCIVVAVKGDIHDGVRRAALLIVLLNGCTEIVLRFLQPGRQVRRAIRDLSAPQGLRFMLRILQPLRQIEFRPMPMYAMQVILRRVHQFLRFDFRKFEILEIRRRVGVQFAQLAAAPVQESFVLP
jgi:hypothetical protein